MSAEIEQYYAPIPYPIADALLAEVTAQFPGEAKKPLITRRALSNSSALYTLETDHIYLRISTDGGGTVFRLFLTPDRPPAVLERRQGFLQRIVKSVWNNWEQLQNEDEALPRVADLNHLPMITVADPVDSQASATSRPKTRRGISENEWARAQARQGRTIDELLPEYARRRKMSNDLVGARELLRKALRNA